MRYASRSLVGTNQRGVTSSADHGSIDENDIVIAYDLLKLHFISLNIMHFIRVMGPTGAGKSSVSFWLCNLTLPWD